MPSQKIHKKARAFRTGMVGTLTCALSLAGVAQVSPTITAAVPATGTPRDADDTSQDRVDPHVTDVRVVLFQVIDAPDGQAHAVLDGEAAQAITAKFKGTSPIFIEVSTLKHYAQAGCRRLRLTLWQDGVVLPGAQVPQRRSVAFDLNYCRDGLPPRSLD